ncbi:fimbrial protein [Siccibacter turicensis]|uniref:fimbrial protein n=1 Tax=Siccibacter turicensis TaxID=357233 RepID=UPI000467AAE1|nr:fimbrial protein [Siccibacter turicensis]
MKKTILGSALSALIIMSSAHAESTDSVITSTDITIDGAISGGDGACTVTTNKNAISLLAGKTTMLSQNDHKTTTFAPQLSITLSGDDICNQRIEEGKIAVRFSGPTDSVEGSVLANVATGANAAKGVGVGIFMSNFARLDLNMKGAVPVTTKPLPIDLQVVRLNGQNDFTEGTVEASLVIEIVRL